MWVSLTIEPSTPRHKRVHSWWSTDSSLQPLPLPLHERINVDVDKRADYMKKLDEETRATIERQVQRHAEAANKHKKPMVFQEGDLVWLHLRTGFLMNATQSSSQEEMALQGTQEDQRQCIDHRHTH